VRQEYFSVVLVHACCSYVLRIFNFALILLHRKCSDFDRRCGFECVFCVVCCVLYIIYIELFSFCTVLIPQSSGFQWISESAGIWNFFC
jgi:hypothetical protein